MVLLSVPLCQSQYSPSGPRPRTSAASGYNGKDPAVELTPCALMASRAVGVPPAALLHSKERPRSCSH
jgi:hypothetical protein